MFMSMSVFVDFRAVTRNNTNKQTSLLVRSKRKALISDESVHNLFILCALLTLDNIGFIHIYICMFIWQTFNTREIYAHLQDGWMD